ncbi:MAG: hypothetical protein V7L04_14110 [Nostoc sp.]|uniref:hypothetical protein n=1 Tax=Nostoc sp. TaxID=1180 RepID=UPI002FF53732
MINVLYDSNGKAIEVKIQIGGIFYPLPWNKETQIIDWSLIDYEPTQTVLKAAWDAWAAGKDLTYELRDRPDLVPVTPTTINPPNWNLFCNSLLKNLAYARISETSTNQNAVRRLETIAISASISKEEIDINLIALFWNQMIAGITVKLTTEEIADWSAIAISSFIPISFDSSGLISVVQ